MTDAAQDGRPQDDAERPDGYVDLTAQTEGGARPQPTGDAAASPVTFEPMVTPPAPVAQDAAPIAPTNTQEADAAVPTDPPALSPTAPAQTVTAAQDAAAGAERHDSDDERVLKSPFPLPDLREGDEDDDLDQSRDEFTTVYDIIDRLEATLEEAKGGIFFPDQVKIDRAQFGDELNELKKMLPVQLERASALMREAERRLEGAQTQANAIVASAQSRAADIVKEANEQAQFLAGQENVTEIARQKARTILDTAQTKADRLTRGADDYSTKVMETLRAQLTKMSGDVDAGLDVLYERRKSAGRDLPKLDVSDYPESR